MFWACAGLKIPSPSRWKASTAARSRCFQSICVKALQARLAPGPKKRRMFRYLTAGESHGPALVGILDGIPAGLRLDAEKINDELRKRQGGHGRGGRMKIERDEI